MPTTQKRIQSCWPATVSRLKRFKMPRQYDHRKEGASAKQLLTRAWQRATGMAAYYKEVSEEACAWSSLIDDEPQLPRRAEDLLNLLLSDDQLMLRERGVQLTRITTTVTDAEMARAVATLSGTICEEREDFPHSILLGDAVRALTNAREIIEDRAS